MLEIADAAIRRSTHSHGRAGWVLWGVFVGLWALSLTPFYANGLHLISDNALQYAGGGYARFGIPYAPTFDDIYGGSQLALIANTVVCYAPCVFVLAVGGVLTKMAISFRSYSLWGIALRVGALLTTLILISVSLDLAGKFFIWGLG